VSGDGSGHVSSPHCLKFQCVNYVCKRHFCIFVLYHVYTHVHMVPLFSDNLFYNNMYLILFHAFNLVLEKLIYNGAVMQFN